MLTVGAIGVVSAFLLALALGRHAARRAETLRVAMEQLSNGDQADALHISGHDEFAVVARAYNAAREKIGDMVASTRASANQLVSAAQQLSVGTDHGKSNNGRQRRELDQVAPAMQHMAASVDNVAGHAQRAASAAVDADRESKRV